MEKTGYQESPEERAIPSLAPGEQTALNYPTESAFAGISQKGEVFAGMGDIPGVLTPSKSTLSNDQSHSKDAPGSTSKFAAFFGTPATEKNPSSTETTVNGAETNNNSGNAKPWSTYMERFNPSNQLAQRNDLPQGGLPATGFENIGGQFPGVLAAEEDQLAQFMRTDNQPPETAQIPDSYRHSGEPEDVKARDTDIGINKIRNPLLREPLRWGTALTASLTRDWAINTPTIAVGSLTAYGMASLQRHIDSEALPYAVGLAALLSYGPYVKTLSAEWRQQAQLLVEKGACDNIVSTAIFSAINPFALRKYPEEGTTRACATISTTIGGLYDFAKGEAQTLLPLAGIIIGVSDREELFSLLQKGELMRYFTDGTIAETLKNGENIQLFLSSMAGANITASALIRMKMMGLDFLFLRKGDSIEGNSAQPSQELPSRLTEK